MSKGLSNQERLIRIELARTRAALERQNVLRSVHELQDSLTPSGLWHSLFSGRSGRGSSRRQANWLPQILSLSRRYPLLLTGASAALTTIGRRRKGWMWRLGLGALASWKLLQRMQPRSPRDNDMP